MTKDELIQTFFTRSFEEDYNEQLMFRNYAFPQEEIIDYVKKIIDIPVIDFVHAINDSYTASYFSTKDIPQFSSFIDATSGICKILIEKGDNGYKYLDIGIMFRNNGEERDKRADLKYGENHSKTAADLGLLQIRMNQVCYLSCFGRIFNYLSDDEKKEYLARFVLRNKFVNWVIFRAGFRIVSLEEEMGILSPSTIKRRLPNVKQYFNLLRGNVETERILNNIQTLR